MYLDTFELRRYNIPNIYSCKCYPDMQYLYFFSHTTIFTTCERVLIFSLATHGMLLQVDKLYQLQYIYTISEDGEICIIIYIYTVKYVHTSIYSEICTYIYIYIYSIIELKTSVLYDVQCTCNIY